MSDMSLPRYGRSYRWVVLIIATLAQACASFFVQGIGAIAVFIQQGLHLTTLQIGLLVSAAQLVPVAGLLVAGELLDRYSERLVVGVGTLIVAFALMAATAASSYTSLLLFLIVVGAGYSTAQPGGSKSVSQWFAASQRGFAMGIRQAGLPLGGALAAAMLPYLATKWGWQSSFLAGGLVALLGAVVFIVFYRSAPERSRTIATDANIKTALSSRLSMLREPSMRNIMFSGISLISVQYGVLVFTALYLHDTLKITITQAAIFLFIAQCAGVTGRILLAAWSDRCRSGRYFPVLVCMVAVIVGLLILIAVPFESPIFLGGLFAYLGFFSFGWYGPWVAYVAESAPPDKTGFALGLAMAINQVAIVSVPPLLGLLIDLTHSYIPGWTLLILVTFFALLATAWSRSEKKDSHLEK